MSEPDRKRSGRPTGGMPDGHDEVREHDGRHEHGAVHERGASPESAASHEHLPVNDAGPPHQHGAPQEPTHDHGSATGHDKHEGHSPEMFRNRFTLSLLLALPILLFDPNFQKWFDYSAPDVPAEGLLQPLLGTVLYFYGGWVFVRGAWRELQDRSPGMMTLIGLAITVAYSYSLAVSFGLAGMPLYWELATLIVVMLLGHWIEMASVQGASKALEHLASLVPANAHRLEEQRTIEVPVGDLVPGELILVRPGEQMPIDGRVIEGSSSVDEAFLTGESEPLPKGEGDEVVAGSVNGEGALTVRVERTGEQTTLSQIQRLVVEAQGSRSRFQGLADRAAAWLTYIAVGAGTVTLLAWLLAGFDFGFALTRTVTVLVMACPHALGLAIPLVLVNATAISARNGILVRNREAFERARDLKVVAFDKTGTLTRGTFVVREVRGCYARGVELDADEALRLSAALESRSEHSMAKAVVAEADRRGLERLPVSQFEVSAGKGVTGVVNGRRLRVGRPEWLEEHGLELPVELHEGLDDAEARGESVVILSDEKQALALITLADEVRPSARHAVRRLQESGVETVMITGDAETVARSVAAELGIERVHARVLPAQKARLVAELKKSGPTAFVGDGINDAPALLEADLGVAIGAGTNVAIESADLVLIEDDPQAVVRALVLSRAASGKMVQNLVWATGYNAVALPLAAGVAYGWGVVLTPAAGAILMSASTVIVAVNAMLLRRGRLD